jgi:hypothetical protein
MMAIIQSEEQSAASKATALSKTESVLIDAYWRAANYLFRRSVLPVR